MGATSLLCRLLLAPLLVLCASSDASATWCNLAQPDLCQGNEQYLDRVEVNSSKFLFEGNDKLIYRSCRHGYFPGYEVSFTDWDSDGDVDVVALDLEGHSVFFERLADGDLSMQPKWLEGVDVAPPLLSQPHSSRNGLGSFGGMPRYSMQAVDWDSDGDMDLVVVGTYSEGSIQYFERTGNQTLVERTGELNPFRNVSISGFWDLVQVADWDGDGDYDVIVIRTSGSSDSRYFERVAEHKLLELTGPRNPFQGFGADISGSGSNVKYSWRQFRVADWDGDHDMDLLVTLGRFASDTQQQLLYIEQLADGSLVLRADGGPFRDLRFTQTCAHLPIHVMDWNGDGLLDLWLGPQLLQRRGKSALTLLEGRYDRFPELAFEGAYGADSEPYLVDWDSDGDLDLLVAETHEQEQPPTATLRYFERTEDGTLQERRQAFYGLLRVIAGRRSRFAIGDSELVTSDGDGAFRYFERRGAALVERSGAASPFSELRTAYTARDETAVQPLLADWDGDGDLDFFMGPPAKRYFERAENGTLVERFGASNPWSQVPCCLTTAVTWKIVDVDGDGDMDAVLAHSYRTGPPSFGLSNLVVTCERLGLLRLRCVPEPWLPQHSPFGLYMHTFGQNACLMSIGDWDGDGDLDVIGITRVNEGASRVLYWNQGWCEARAPCSSAGICSPASGRCLCAQGYDSRVGDCSGCSQGFYTPRRLPGVVRQCRRCASAEPPLRVSSPGAAAPVCTRRGTCFDDLAARQQAQAKGLPNVSLAAALGNGSCTCSEPYFGGADEMGRVTCGAGSCPDGSEEVFGNGSLAAAIRTCRPCAPGTSSQAGQPCSPCVAGSFAGASAARCDLCPTGHVAKTSNAVECTPCPAGKFASQSLMCLPCSNETVSGPASQSCTPCVSSFVRMTAVRGHQACGIDQAGIAGIIALFFGLLGLGLALLLGLRHSAPIADVSMEHGALVLTTWGPHRLLPWGWAVPEVHLSGTGVPALDSPGAAGPLRAKVSCTEQLVLLPPEGSTGPWEASMGSVHVRPAQAWRCVGLAYAPSLAWLVAAAVVISASAHLVPPATISIEAFLAVCCLLVWQLREGRRASWTPLAMQRFKFLQQLRSDGIHPQRTERGPQRAVSAGQLLEFHEHFQAFIKERSTYYVCPTLVKPLTEGPRLSYAEVVGSGAVQWFVSHYWGTCFRHFAYAVRSHARAHCRDGDWQAQRYWICTFSNNQWEVAAEVGNGRWRDSSFYLALRDASCQGTAMVIDQQAMPLTRAWCLFEVVQTLVLSEQCVGFGGLTLCTESGVLNHGNTGTDVCMGVAARLATMDLRNAEASDPGDLEMIRGLVNGMPGGFDAANAFVRGSIRSALLAVRGRFDRDFAHLVRALEEGASGGDAARSDELVPDHTAAQAAAPASLPTLLGSQTFDLELGGVGEQKD